MAAPDLALALINALDDEVLDVLIAKLAPRLYALPMPAPDTDGWIDAKQAAAYLGMPANTLWKLTSAREIPFEQDKPGAKLWFKRSELDAWRRGEWNR